MYAVMIVLCANWQTGTLSHHQLIGFLQELRRDRLVQSPGDIHRSGTLVLHIVGGSQVGVGSSTAGDAVGFEFPDEQQHLTALLPVVDVALTGGRGIRCGALALPVEHTLIDGIVLVHGSS